MSSCEYECERVIEVEDMVLGLSHEDDLAAHVESCADCTGAREMFLSERELFAARPVVQAPAFAHVLERTRKQSAASWRGNVRAFAVRAAPALAGIAACVAAITFGRPFAPAPIPPCASSATIASAPATDDPLTCDARAFSSSTPAPAMTLATHDAPVCTDLGAASQSPGTHDVCDFPQVMSVATP